jgi:hypothetical protein
MTQAYHVCIQSVVNTGIVLLHPSQFVVNGQSVLYNIPVFRNHANSSLLVHVAIALVFLRLLLLSINTIGVGGVLSIVKF